MKFDLDPGIRSALGKRDPARVDKEYIYTWLQGPFCKRCHRSLHATGQYDGHVSSKCPYCSLPWARRDVYENDLKEEVYHRLDAEYRRDGALAPSDRADQTDETSS